METINKWKYIIKELIETYLHCECSPGFLKPFNHPLCYRNFFSFLFWQGIVPLNKNTPYLPRKKNSTLIIGTYAEVKLVKLFKSKSDIQKRGRYFYLSFMKIWIVIQKYYFFRESPRFFCKPLKYVFFILFDQITKNKRTKFCHFFLIISYI